MNYFFCGECRLEISINNIIESEIQKSNQRRLEDLNTRCHDLNNVVESLQKRIDDRDTGILELIDALISFLPKYQDTLLSIRQESTSS